MSSTYKSLVLGLALLAAGGLPAAREGSAQLSAPQRVIQEVSARLQGVLQHDRRRLADDPGYVYQLVDDVLAPHVDMERVSALILARYWRQATPQQRQAFASEFRHMLVRTYATAFHELCDWEIRFGPLRSAPGDTRVVVQTQVLHGGAQPVAVDYRMHLEGDRWLAYDVKIEGISLITNYRASFARLIQSKGIDGLIERMTRLNQEKQHSAPGKLAAKDQG